MKADLQRWMSFSKQIEPDGIGDMVEDKSKNARDCRCRRKVDDGNSEGYLIVSGRRYGSSPKELERSGGFK